MKGSGGQKACSGGFQIELIMFSLHPAVGCQVIGNVVVLLFIILTGMPLDGLF